MTDSYREVYLDHNATTYLREEVVNLLVGYYKGNFGFANPSSKTKQGEKAKGLINSARNDIANALSAKSNEIIFTGSGSEANNMAIKGLAFKHLNNGGNIVTSKIEHPSVLSTLNYLESKGFSVTYLDVGKDGLVLADSVLKAIKKDTFLVSIMAVNNEIGTINPIKEIGQICRERGITFHVDAIQGFGKIPLNPGELGVSMLSISGHKIYAPKGIGALYVNSDISLDPLIHGGGQEHSLRSGTENVGHIIAFGLAAKLANNEMIKEQSRLSDLQDYFLSGIRKIEPDAIINGSLEHRVSNNLSIGFPGVISATLIINLNRAGISVSAMSACKSGWIKNSHVLKAIGSDTDNYGTLRFSFGLKTEKKDLDYLFRVLKDILRKAKSKNSKIGFKSDLLSA